MCIIFLLDDFSQFGTGTNYGIDPKLDWLIVSHRATGTLFEIIGFFMTDRVEKHTSLEVRPNFLRPPCNGLKVNRF